ncbi:hypothetical protein BSZ19_12605 [Bradyrhizobium japonicum]|uniref:Uncharacterized protein n=1 Tax=Bradyrhizobium japonicum TaxID=375 RepID=A0A1Y2JUK8_BRAJP|nr:hypothetical protein BSZ19_12605 [Bradyrhizobium japonicum]
MRGALATKQSRLRPWKDSGLLRCARNDGVEAAIPRPFIFPRLQFVSRPPHRFHVPGPIRPRMTS